MVALGAALVLAAPGDAAERRMVLGMDARDLSSLDPAFVRTGADEFIVRQMFNTLVSPPDGTLELGLDEVQGELAESWEVSEDGTVWTFRLRQGVQWHHGYGEVTAEDVKFSYERQQDPEVGATYAGNYSDIEEIVVVDDYTVEFHLSKPSAFLHVTALMPRFGGYVVSKQAAEERGEDFRLNPVGSGPFQFVSYSPQTNVVVEAHPDYWGGEQSVPEIEFRYVPDTNARTVGFMGGELDLIEGVREPGWAERLQQNYPDAQIDILFPGSTQLLFLNLSKPPLDDPRVRAAIAHAIDRGVWGEAFGILHEPMYGPAPSQFYGGLEEKDVPEALRYPYDPDRARELLAEAGHPDGVTISAYISERADYSTNMLLIQDLLRQVGIEIDLRVVDHPTFHGDLYRDTNTLIVISTTQPPNVIPVMRTFFHSESIVTKPQASRNYSHYGDIAGNIDELLEAAEIEPDPARQLEMLRDVQLQILEDLPVVPLQQLGVVWVRQPWVELPYEPTAGLGHYSLAGVRLSQ
jgi:peptide/nickel transport system substrate-binding protein